MTPLEITQASLKVDEDARAMQPQPPTSPGDQAPQGTQGTGEGLCPTCGGSGTVSGAPCATCEGTGKVTVGVGGG